MITGKCKRLLLAATALSLVLTIFPFAPSFARSEVVLTEMRRLDFTSLADYASGELEGGVELQEGPEQALLTLANGRSGTYTSQTLPLSLAASSVAAHWIQRVGGERSVAFSIRTSADEAEWTHWQEIEAEGGRETDGGLIVFGNLVATPGARFVQYRIELSAVQDEPVAVSNISLFAFDSANAPVRQEIRFSLIPRERVLATIKPLDIVSRGQWGANESLGFETQEGEGQSEIWPEEIRTVEKIVVHHTAGPNVCASAEPYCQRQSVIAINDIHYYHAVVNGWGDIGYNSLIGYDGRIYEGRHSPQSKGDSEPLASPVVAGHALGYNASTHGIGVMGDFQREPVPDLQYNSLATLVGWIVKSNLAKGGEIDPMEFSALARDDGQSTAPLPSIIGHRDVNATECPGDFLQERLVQLRHLAQRLVEWPPLSVELRASPQGDTIAYHIFVDNHEPSLVKGLIIKGAVPANVEFVDSWAGSPYSNRGVFDGSVVSWFDSDAQLAPGRDRREYVYIVRPAAGVQRSDIETTAWVEFAEPVRGVAMSDAVGADQPVEIIIDTVAGGRVDWTGDWVASRNVYGYYGDGYQYHEPGDGNSAYTWEAELQEAGAYEVFGWWAPASDRATSAPFTIEASDGTHTVQVDQRQPGKRWVSLGSYSFGIGAARVRLNDNPSGVAIADAIRFRKVK